MPADRAVAAAAAQHREAAIWAASVGGVRGDLWTEAAFTYANLLWSDGAANANIVAQSEAARAILDRAIRNAPNRSDAWLTLTGLASRFPSLGLDAVESMKMSYYTGLSETQLVPLRLQIATHAEKLDDIELRELIAHDIRLLLTRKQRSSLRQVYDGASTSGKSFISETVRDIDPSAADELSPNMPRQVLPLPH